MEIRAAEILRRLGDAQFTSMTTEPTRTPHRELCQFCPGQPAMCSWEPERTLAELP